MIFVYLALGWLAVSLGMTAGWIVFRRDFKTADTPPDPDLERRARNVARAQAQIDAERDRTGHDVIDLAARQVIDDIQGTRRKETP